MEGRNLKPEIRNQIQTPETETRNQKESRNSDTSGFRFRFQVSVPDSGFRVLVSALFQRAGKDLSLIDGAALD